MAKAINWPKEFLSEVINEEADIPRIALRIGSLYFDNGYYTPDEIVDIRVDGKVVRKAQILGNMELLKMKDIPEEVFGLYKSNLSTKEDAMKFLASTYNQQVDENTIVTVIPYKNLSIQANDSVEDPHY